MTPEPQARQEIDRMLHSAGWHVCGVSDANIHAARGVAIREFALDGGHGYTDYLLTKAQAGWLRRLIEETTGRRVAVRPVVLFPGWFIRPTEGAPREVWVLEPKALPGFLAHEPPRLNPDEVRLIAPTVPVPQG